MHSFVVDAGCFDVIAVQGPDAERFLQGQLTCDVAAMADNQLVHGACCTNKGRVIATFLLLRQGDRYFLCMTQGLGRVLAEALRKYLPFYKQCTLTDTYGPSLTAYAGELADEVLQQHDLGNLQPGTVGNTATGWLCRLTGSPTRVLRWGGEQAQNSGSPEHSQEHWEALGLLQGEYPFHVSDSGVFTPQDLHLDRNGFVSFSKGCYTGQEIVARMHYRGKLKKALYLTTLTQPIPGDAGGKHLPVTNASDEAVGHCLLVRRLTNQSLALLELPADFAASLTGLTLAGAQTRQGCLFEPTVIQSANLQTV